MANGRDEEKALFFSMVIWSLCCIPMPKGTRRTVETHYLPLCLMNVYK